MLPSDNFKDLCSYLVLVIHMNMTIQQCRHLQYIIDSKHFC